MDSVFKTKVEPAPEQAKVVATNTTVDRADNIETPYLDTPDFLDTYFGIGTEWHDRDQNFYPEVQKIDAYIKSKISEGSIANDQTAVRQFIKGMEKLNNLTKETRSVIKLEVLANYTEFLRKNERLKSNLRRYG